MRVFLVHGGRVGEPFFRAVKGKPLPGGAALSNDSWRFVMDVYLVVQSRCTFSKTAFTIEEETELAFYILRRSIYARGIKRVDLLVQAAELKDRILSQCSDTDRLVLRKATLNDSWYDRFRVRHPYISLRKGSGLELQRYLSCTPSIIAEHFRRLRSHYDRLQDAKYLEEKRLEFPNYEYSPLEASQIANMDETFCSCAEGSKVLGARGARRVNQLSGSKVPHITAVGCIFADGTTTRPCLILAQAGAKKDRLVVTPEAEFSLDNDTSVLACVMKTSSGWMTGSAMVAWFKNVYLPHVGDKRPQLLIFDNHGTHHEPEFLTLCKNYDIDLYFLPAHSSHLLQPADMAVFGPVHKAMSRIRDYIVNTNPDVTFDQNLSANIAINALDRVCTADSIRGGFERTGVWPFNPDAADAPVPHLARDSDDDIFDDDDDGVGADDAADDAADVDDQEDIDTLGEDPNVVAAVPVVVVGEPDCAADELEDDVEQPEPDVGVAQLELEDDVEQPEPEYVEQLDVAADGEDEPARIAAPAASSGTCPVESPSASTPISVLELRKRPAPSGERRSFLDSRGRPLQRLCADDANALAYHVQRATEAQFSSDLKHCHKALKDKETIIDLLTDKINKLQAQLDHARKMKMPAGVRKKKATNRKKSLTQETAMVDRDTAMRLFYQKQSETNAKEAEKAARREEREKKRADKEMERKRKLAEREEREIERKRKLAEKQEQEAEKRRKADANQEKKRKAQDAAGQAAKTRREHPQIANPVEQAAQKDPFQSRSGRIVKPKQINDA